MADIFIGIARKIQVVIRDVITLEIICRMAPPVLQEKQILVLLTILALTFMMYPVLGEEDRL